MLLNIKIAVLSIVLHGATGISVTASPTRSAAAVQPYSPTLEGKPGHHVVIYLLVMGSVW
jgi:hypothetical protein